MRHNKTSKDRSGEELFLELLEPIEKAIRFATRKLHLFGVDADDFASQVYVRLIEGDYAILRRFESRRGNIRAYLTTVVMNIGRDFRISQWGKWRPSSMAKRLGPSAVRIEQFFRDGYSQTEAYEKLQEAGAGLSRNEFEKLVALLPARTGRQFVALEDHVDQLKNEKAAQPLLKADDMRLGEIQSKLENVLKSLNEEDRQLLRMQFVDGQRVAEIARLLGKDQRALYPRMNKLLRTLRTRLEDAAVNWDVVERALEDHRYGGFLDVLETDDAPDAHGAHLGPPSNTSSHAQG